MWDKLASVRPQQTISDDARSRLARRDYENRYRMQRVPFDENGNQELWFDVSLTVGDHSGIPIPWSGKDADDVIKTFTEWLNTAEFRTIDFELNGSPRKLTFRTGFVAHFEVGSGRRHQ